MSKQGYYRYNAVIYPRRLCVYIGLSGEDVNKCFEGINGEELNFDFNGYDGMEFGEIKEKATGLICILVVFPNKRAMTMSVCCHEASHACDDIEKAIDMEHGGEASAYLLGWLASCINKARLGIGEFIEIKDKEK
uniref:hypothetical protein n=1 Tax=Prevotella sp. TaxID=59823 RepID=UPI00402698C4